MDQSCAISQFYSFLFSLKKNHEWNPYSYHIYKYQAQIKLSSINIKPTESQNIYLLPRIGARRSRRCSLYTNQLLNANHFYKIYIGFLRCNKDNYGRTFVRPWSVVLSRCSSPDARPNDYLNSASEVITCGITIKSCNTGV